jgi:hypothetical protein
MVKRENVRSKQLLEIKGIRCIYLKVLMIKSDTYHDTWTNYLMEQELSQITAKKDSQEEDIPLDGTCLRDKTNKLKVCAAVVSTSRYQ